jgi:cobalamin-dependent methionine synthase I
MCRFAMPTATEELTRFHFLRQQMGRKGTAPDYRSLADYVAPLDSGRIDHIGAFAVAAGEGVDAARQGTSRKTTTTTTPSS